MPKGIFQALTPLLILPSSLFNPAFVHRFIWSIMNSPAVSSAAEDSTRMEDTMNSPPVVEVFFDYI